MNNSMLFKAFSIVKLFGHIFAADHLNIIACNIYKHHTLCMCVILVLCLCHLFVAYLVVNALRGRREIKIIIFFEKTTTTTTD